MLVPLAGWRRRAAGPGLGNLRRPGRLVLLAGAGRPGGRGPAGGEAVGRARIGARQVKGEGTAAAELALRPDAAAELRGDLAADGQAKPRPAVATAGGPVALLEGVEDRLQVVR